MASRLAHELRTPLVVVKSSLENLLEEDGEKARRQYLNRAMEGTKRLTLILHRMREATRLEQLLQQTVLEVFDLSSLLRAAAENYHLVYPGVHFGVTTPTQPVLLAGAADLISQALDKLVGNAVDFYTPGTPIELHLTVNQKMIRLEVRNCGPTLPNLPGSSLFDSMVSLRPQQGTEPHLGLGLYLVRLICEFHNGGVAADNLDDGSGVSFSLTLPLAR